MGSALDGTRQTLGTRRQDVAVYGHREYNPGWHTAIDLKHLLTVSEAITRSALDRKESRGGHFREDFPDKDPAAAKIQHRHFQGARTARCNCGANRFPPMPEELKQVIEEMK